MLRVLLIAGGVLLAQACTAVVNGGEEQCASDQDCADRGFAGAICVEQTCQPLAIDPVWGCLGNVTEPEPDPTRTVEFSILLTFAVGGGTASQDTVVDACDKLDIACTGNNPDLPTGIRPDAEGMITMAVPEGFDGFVQIIGPEIVDSRVYVGRPLVGPPPVDAIELFRPGDIELLATLTGEEPDPTRGSAVVLAIDCSGEGAGGVRFETPNADDSTIAFYLINQAPALPPAATATDLDGFGGFFNLPAGAAVVRAIRDEDDVFIGESSFQVLADTISYVLVAPTPR